MKYVVSIALVVSCMNGITFAEDLSVLTPADKPRQMLRDYLRRHVHAALDRRLAAYEQLTTKEQIEAYQLRLRSAFRESLGEFPAKTPLRPRIVGELSGEGFSVEKLIYESRPGFLVTAVLYLPSTSPPYPAVLLPCGHSENGKAADAYQRASILLAKNGLAVLCYDPIGQGERKQILELDKQGQRLPKSRYRATSEHMLEGVAPIPLGQNLASYRIWDAMRGIDYLCSRSDIDASRIGCTGNSGGGLMTSYLMALDDRIFAAAPGCFITTTRRKNEKPGPGDAEQNIFGQIAYGMDHPDYILMHAPKPTLICAATRDYVPIEGTWEAFRQAKRLYTRLGAAQRIDLIETPEKHGFSTHLRVGVVRWMRRWLLDVDDAVTERSFDVFSDQQLQCTPRGQVLLLTGTRSIFELYQDEADRVAVERRELQSELNERELLKRIRKVVGVRPLNELPLPESNEIGKVRRDDLKLEKLVLRSELGIVLPSIFFEPNDSYDFPVLYVNSAGKNVIQEDDGILRRDQLFWGDAAALAVDLRGFGETETKAWRYGAMADLLGSNAAEYFIAYMFGRSLVGMRAEDLLVSARYLASRTGKEKVILMAVGDATVPAAVAAVLEPRLFARVQLDPSGSRPSQKFSFPLPFLENTVHGSAHIYTQADLLRRISQRRGGTR